MIMWQEMKLNCLMIITEAVQSQGGRASSTTEELGAGLFRGKGSRDKTKPRTDTVTILTTLYKYVQSGYGHGPSSSSASSTWKAKYRSANWQVIITKDRWVLETVQGYCIKFADDPYQPAKPHPPTAGP